MYNALRNGNTQKCGIQYEGVLIGNIAHGVIFRTGHICGDLASGRVGRRPILAGGQIGTMPTLADNWQSA